MYGLQYLEYLARPIQSIYQDQVDESCQFELFSELERSQWKFIVARLPSNIQTVRNSNSKQMNIYERSYI